MGIQRGDTKSTGIHGGRVHNYKFLKRAKVNRALFFSREIHEVGLGVIMRAVNRLDLARWRWTAWRIGSWRYGFLEGGRLGRLLAERRRG